jgi:hypothetical protein
MAVMFPHLCQHVTVDICIHADCLLLKKKRYGQNDGISKAANRRTGTAALNILLKKK